MKKLILISLCMVSMLTSTVTESFAQEKAPLGNGNIAIKFDYINFTNSFFDPGSDGVYFGVEGYFGISRNFYLGGEIGTAGNLTAFGGEDIEYIPVEFNAKYAFDSTTNFVFDVGGGLSYSRAEITQVNLFAGDTDRGSGWLLGGQVFTDLTYKIGWFSLGLNAKYQITEDFKNISADLSNYRCGLSLGAIF